MAFPTDPDLAAKARSQLERETIGWLSTVGDDGCPHAVPVWFFLQQDETITILSEPDTVKVRNLRARPQTLFHLETGNEFGADVVIVTGDAQVTDNAGPDWVRRNQAAYEAKYARGIAAFGMPLEQIAATFSTAIGLQPRKVQCW